MLLTGESVVPFAVIMVLRCGLNVLCRIRKKRAIWGLQEAVCKGEFAE